MDANPLLPLNAQSWSFRLAAGSDFSAADYRRVTPLARLVAESGSLKLGRIMPKITSGSSDALTSTIIKNRYQVIRTGSGDIDIAAGRDVQLLNQFATIYTAGVKVSDATLGGAFDLPYIVLSDQGETLGAVQQDPTYPVQFSLGGGNVTIHAQGDIAHYTKAVSHGPLVAESERQLPLNWLYRRGYVDAATGRFGVTLRACRSRVARCWSAATRPRRHGGWISAIFFEGVGALGGGNVSLLAEGNVSNVDAVAPTNARLPKSANSASDLVELGGGDVTVRAGRNIDAGVYYVERGEGILSAGTKSRRIPRALRRLPPSARSRRHRRPRSRRGCRRRCFSERGGSMFPRAATCCSGPTANVFLLPEGLNNSIWYKTWFSTYSPTSEVDVSSLGGSLTLRTRAALPGSGSTTGLLQAWLQTQLLLGTSSLPTSSYFQPWLRINETSVAAYTTTSSLLPPLLRATAFTGDLNLVGAFNLVPARKHARTCRRRRDQWPAAQRRHHCQRRGARDVGNRAHRCFRCGSERDSGRARSVCLPRVCRKRLATRLEPRARRSRAIALPRQTFCRNGRARFPCSRRSRRCMRPACCTRRIPRRCASTRLRAIFPDSRYSRRRSRESSPGGTSPTTPSICRMSRRTTRAWSTPVEYRRIQRQLAAARAVGDAGQSAPWQHARARGAALRRHSARRAWRAGGCSRAGCSISDPARAMPTARARASRRSATRATRICLSPGQVSSPPQASGRRRACPPAISISTDSSTSFSRTKRTRAISRRSIPSCRSRILQSPLRAAEPYRAASLLPRSARRGPRSQRRHGRLRRRLRGHRCAVPEDHSATAGGSKRARATSARKNGGDISLFVPNGGLTLANSTIGNPLVPPGIVTESGGNVSIFTDESVNIGIGRIFTLRGGNEIIWSSQGDIAAGARRRR